MANVFDQFDEPSRSPTSNVFDQFDQGGAGDNVSRETTAPPQNWENFKAGAVQGLTSIPGFVVNAMGRFFGYDPTLIQSYAKSHGLGDVPDMGESVSHLLDKYVVGGLTGFNPEDVKAKTTSERLSRAAGMGATSALIPGGEEMTVGSLLRNGAIGAASTTGGQAISEAVPEQYKPIANVLGTLATGASIGGLSATRNAVSQTGRKLAEPFQAAVSGEAAQAGARRILADKASDISQVNLDLGNLPDELVPGSKPTTFQKTGDFGLGTLEREQAAKNPDLFKAREAEQNIARTSALGDVQQGGNPADLTGFFNSHLRLLDAQTAAHIDQLHAGAQQALEALGGRSTPEAYGEGLRGILQEAENTARQRERGLWQAVDPEGNLTGNVQATKQAAKDITSNISQTAKPPEGEEAAIFNAAKGMSDVTPANDLIDLRSRVSTAMRNELINNGQSASYARLSRLRGAIQNNLAQTISNKVAQEQRAVGTGALTPEETTLQRVKAWQDEFYANKAQRAATGTDMGAPPEGGATAPNNAGGAALPAGGGPSVSAGDQGLPGASPPAVNVGPTDIHDSRGGEHFGTKTVTVGGKPVASANVTLNGDNVHIHDIVTSPGVRRQGYASALVDDLFKEHPGAQISVGGMTDDGSKFFGSRYNVDENGVLTPKQPPEPGQPTFDQAAAGRLAEATAATKERAGTFGRGPVSQALGKAGQQDLYRLPEARVPEKFFHPGPTGFQDMQSLYSAVGPERATPLVVDYAASSLRKAAMRDDGTLDPRAFSRWQTAHQDALRALPDNVRANFRNASAAAQAVQDATALRTQALRDAQSDAIGKLTGLAHPEDVTRAVGAIFGSKNSVEQMENIARAASKDPFAMQGLRQAVADHIAQRFISNREAGASGVNEIQANAFQNFVKQNRPALSKVFKPEEVDNLQAIADDLRRSNRSINATKLKGGSNTTQDAYQVLKNPATGRPTMLKFLLTTMGGGAGLATGGWVPALIGGVGMHMLQSMREAGLKNIDDVVTQAMLNPDFAHALLQKMPPKPNIGSAALAARALRRSAVAASVSAIANRTQQGGQQ